MSDSVRTERPFQAGLGPDLSNTAQETPPQKEDRYRSNFRKDPVSANKMVFYGDHQIHHTVRRTSIQSKIYDRFIDVSIRPQAVVLAAPLFQREAMQLIRNKYQDHHQYNMGDVLDTSNTQEWGIYLNAEQEDLDLGSVERQQNLPELPEMDEFYAAFLAAGTQSDNILPPLVEGNHDGAYAGNGLNHRVRPVKMSQRIHLLQFSIRAIDQKIARLEKQTPSEALRIRLANLKRTKAGHLKEIQETTVLLKNFKAKIQELDLDPKLLPPRLIAWLVNSFLGAPSGSPLYSSRGAASLNAGGGEHIVDKKKFIGFYLSNRYKNIGFNPETLEPLVTKLVHHSPSTGYYRTNKSTTMSLQHTLPQNTLQHFDNFWKEVRPGEYLSLLEFPGREMASANQRYIMLQAFDQGVDASGKHIYTFMLDGMDMTQENVPIAFFGAMSGWQNKLCQIFIDTMRLRNGEKGNLFYHLSHFPLKDNSKGKWEKHGWLEYFKQPDVAPFVFAAHRHHRGVLSENTPTNVGLDLPLFGTTSIKKKKSASIINPSLTDNMEFMTAQTRYNPATDKHSVQVDYHKIFSEDPQNEHYKEFSDDVIAEVESHQSSYASHAYRKDSQMRSDPLTALYHLLSTDHRTVIAFDTIPIMIRQFNDTIEYTQSYLKFLRDDLGNDDPFYKKVQGVLSGLLKHREHWLYGNPDSEDEVKRLGYFNIKSQCAKLPRHEVIDTLAEFNDLFATPIYDRLRMLITDTPVSKDHHKAYDFWLLLGKRAQDEENLPTTLAQRQKLKKFALPDSQTLVF